jgi:hypothetical protein
MYAHGFEKMAEDIFARGIIVGERIVPVMQQNRAHYPGVCAPGTIHIANTVRLAQYATKGGAITRHGKPAGIEEGAVYVEKKSDFRGCDVISSLYLCIPGGYTLGSFYRRIIRNTFFRTNSRALPAGNTRGVVDNGKVINNMYRVLFAGSHAPRTAYARYLTNFIADRSLCVRTAKHVHTLARGDKLDQALGAYLHAHSATGTGFLIDSQVTVIVDIHGVKTANSHARSKAQAPVRTCEKPFKEGMSGTAIHEAVIAVFMQGNVVAAPAVHARYARLACRNTHAHDYGYLVCRL